MKKILILFITIFLLSGCSDTEPKNIYHSKWVSSEGYRLLIADPAENSKISKESCSVYMGDDTLGTCIATFDKDKGTVTVSWSYWKGKSNYLDNLKVGGVTISKDTEEFEINDIKFKYHSNLMSDN